MIKFKVTKSGCISLVDILIANWIQWQGLHHDNAVIFPSLSIIKLDRKGNHCPPIVGLKFTNLGKQKSSGWSHCSGTTVLRSLHYEDSSRDRHKQNFICHLLINSANWKWLKSYLYSYLPWPQQSWRFYFLWPLSRVLNNYRQISPKPFGNNEEGNYDLTDI